MEEDRQEYLAVEASSCEVSLCTELAKGSFGHRANIFFYPLAQRAGLILMFGLGERRVLKEGSSSHRRLWPSD